jgi:hypothetical protein
MIKRLDKDKGSAGKMSIMNEKMERENVRSRKENNKEGQN